jgi:hypothetical protein
VIVLIARLPHGLGDAPDPDVTVRHRLHELSEMLPVVSGRLRGSEWVAGSLPDVAVAADDDPLSAVPGHRFNLGQEPPLRVTLASNGRWLALCGHHSAFDGMQLFGVMRMLVAGIKPTPPSYEVPSTWAMPWGVMRRLARPAEPVARSTESPKSESLAVRTLPLGGKDVTARLAEAGVHSICSHNARRGTPCRRVGISVAVGGLRGEAATYRRVDLKPGQLAGPAVRSAVKAAMLTQAAPLELVYLPPGARFFRRLVPRLSDTFLLSNLGRQVLPGADRVDFFPVARGRSAVAFGAVGLAGGMSTLTIRARNLTQADASALLDHFVDSVGEPEVRSYGVGT